MKKHDTIRSRQQLIEAVRQGFLPDFLFFWGHTPTGRAPVGKECLSQWWLAEFTVDDVKYPSAEHYMMAEKARLFGDSAALGPILEAPTPMAAKRLGRSVRGFDEQRWAAVRFEIVIAANHAKFSQNLALCTFLLETGSQVLVEASPYDRVWGIGLAQADPRVNDPALWQGLNLLGFALMETRRQLQGHEQGSL